MSERDIFIAALQIEDSAERAAYVEQACAGDAALAGRVRGLLDAHGRAGQFLHRPAPEQLAAQAAPSVGPTQPASRVAGDAGRAPGAPSEPTQAEPPHDERDDSLDFLAPSSRADSLGRLGHYEVLNLVGRGGMGVVLRAFDEVLHRVVAIKVMAPQLATSATARRRFLREARAAAAVSHDNVVTIHAVEEGDGVPFLVMQYVAGMSLQDKLDREGPPELREVLRIGLQAAAGLAAAHLHGIIHRDVKPANILLENGVERVKLTDFGLARAIDDASLTQSGVLAGTPQYMSPEQAEGRPADHRSDLFSLGSVLYALCTGRPPFRADTTTAVLRRVCEDTPRPIREVNPDVPGWLCDIIGRLHAKEPSQRFQSAAEVAGLLGGYLARLQRPEASEPAALGLEAQKTLNDDRLSRAAIAPIGRRRRWSAAVAVLVLLAGFGLTETTGVTRISSAVIRIFTPEGPLVVEMDPPDKIGPPKPFTILGAGGARSFGTLSEAVLAASDGDTIEVGGDGPFDAGRVAITQRALTIRAGGGFRPVLRWGHPTDSPALIEVERCDLVLEGLDLRYAGDPKDWTHSTRMIWARGGRLYLANCVFLKWGRGNIVYAVGPTHIEARNCLLLADSETGRLNSVGWESAARGARIHVEGCIFRHVGLGVGYGEDTDGVTVTLRRNTVLANHLLSAQVYSSREMPPRQPDGLKPTAVHSAENVLLTTHGSFHLRQAAQKAGERMTSQELDASIRARFTWRDSRNLFGTASGLLRAELAGERWDREPRTPKDWDRFWGQENTGSLFAKPEFVRADLPELRASSPQDVRISEYRLADGSPGKGAGEGGRDLGADIDLVGPGPAYERWKKTPEYRQWLKERGRGEK